MVRRAQTIPSPEAAAAFVRDYESARGRRFGVGERVIAAAAATYALTHIARCEHARDPAGEPAAGSARRALLAYAPLVPADLLADPTKAAARLPNDG